MRTFLSQHLFSPLQGMTFGLWWSLLRENAFGIDPPYWPRAAFQTAVSLMNTGFALVEAALFARKVAAVPIKPPLIILGHFRSGTSHLHNLLSLDPAFTAPSLFQTLYPNTFLTTEWFLPWLGRPFLLRKRPHDNMALGFDEPSEDELALLNESGLSPYLAWVFPQRAHVYDRLLTFVDVGDQAKDRWKLSLRHFLAKLTLKDGQPVVLKSPPHTARIRLLLELFPEARFVHIRRNPHDVYRSTRHMYDTTMRYWQLQRADSFPVEDRIIASYRRMYDAFFDQRPLIPDGQFHEIAYEELVSDPIGQVQSVYEALGLPGFESVRPRLGSYLESIGGYRTNQHAALTEPLRGRISEQWRRCFDEWGYPV
jgi:hypothetical protein